MDGKKGRERGEKERGSAFPQIHEGSGEVDIMRDVGGTLDENEDGVVLAETAARKLIAAHDDDGMMLTMTGMDDLIEPGFSCSVPGPVVLLNDRHNCHGSPGGTHRTEAAKPRREIIPWRGIIESKMHRVGGSCTAQDRASNGIRGLATRKAHWWRVHVARKSFARLPDTEAHRVR